MKSRVKMTPEQLELVVSLMAQRNRTQEMLDVVAGTILAGHGLPAGTRVLAVEGDELVLDAGPQIVMDENGRGATERSFEEAEGA